MSEFFTAVENRGILSTLKEAVDAVRQQLNYSTDEALDFLRTSKEKRELFYQAYGRDG